MVDKHEVQSVATKLKALALDYGVDIPGLLIKELAHYAVTAAHVSAADDDYVIPAEYLKALGKPALDKLKELAEKQGHTFGGKAKGKTKASENITASLAAVEKYKHPAKIYEGSKLPKGGYIGGIVSGSEDTIPSQLSGGYIVPAKVVAKKVLDSPTLQFFGDKFQFTGVIHSVSIKMSIDFALVTAKSQAWLTAQRQAEARSAIAKQLEKESWCQLTEIQWTTSKELDPYIHTLRADCYAAAMAPYPEKD